MHPLLIHCSQTRIDIHKHLIPAVLYILSVYSVFVFLIYYYIVMIIHIYILCTCTTGGTVKI